MEFLDRYYENDKIHGYSIRLLLQELEITIPNNEEQEYIKGQLLEHINKIGYLTIEQATTLYKIVKFGKW